eukprot:1157925-Pelagomonas_calceolata.AAC.3
MACFAFHEGGGNGASVSPLGTYPQYGTGKIEKWRCFFASPRAQTKAVNSLEFLRGATFCSACPACAQESWGVGPPTAAAAAAVKGPAAHHVHSSVRACPPASW